MFGSNEEHCITEISEPIDILNVQFEPYILWEREENTELLSVFNARRPGFENIFSDDGEIKRGLLAIEDELCNKRACYGVAARCILFTVLTGIIRKYPYFDYGKAVKGSDSISKNLSAVINYIHKNLENKLTLNELAGVAYLSPTYFSYVFKKFNGISLWEYISIKRVERAVEMLKKQKLTKIEIAERCGFSSSSHFYKTFTAVTGKKPSDFVKDEA